MINSLQPTSPPSIDALALPGFTYTS